MFVNVIPGSAEIFLFLSAFDILELSFLLFLRLMAMKTSDIAQNKRTKPTATVIPIIVNPAQKGNGLQERENARMFNVLIYHR